MISYTYKIGHKLPNACFIWGKTYSFKSSPFPGQDSLQQVIVFGDMGKVIVVMRHVFGLIAVKMYDNFP